MPVSSSLKVAHPSKDLSKGTVHHVLGHGSRVADSELGVVHHFGRFLEKRRPKNALVREAMRAAETLAEDKHRPQSHLLKHQNAHIAATTTAVFKKTGAKPSSQTQTID